MKLFQFKRSAERDPFAIPRSVQQSIPIKRIYKDGIFEVSGKFSKTWRFFDVNYKVASLEKQMELFMAYCAFLNSLPVSAAAKITLFNRRLNQRAFSSALMLEFEGDGQDQYRAEYNDLLTDKAADSNNLIQEKYITISVEKKNIEEARTFFNRVHTDLTNGLARLDSAIREVNINERLRLFHDFFRPGEEQNFRFDLMETMRRGHDFKDAIAPDCLSFKKNYYEMGDLYGRVLFLRDYGSFIQDDLITSLMDFPRNMMLSIDIIPMGMDEGSNPLGLKSDFIMSLCQQIMGPDGIDARAKSIIDRCTANVYREYIKSYKGETPTLKDLHDDLMKQKEPLAHDIALALELFTTGSLNVFSHQTNIDTNKKKITLEALCAKDIQDFYQDQLQRVSASSVIHYHANIHKALKYAVKMDMIATNPADKVERPKKEKFQGGFYSNDELDKLFAAAAGTRLELAIMFGAFYGLRRSEIVGLKWDAFDFDKG